MTYVMYYKQMLNPGTFYIEIIFQYVRYDNISKRIILSIICPTDLTAEVTKGLKIYFDKNLLRGD